MLDILDTIWTIEAMRINASNGIHCAGPRQNLQLTIFNAPDSSDSAFALKPELGSRHQTS